MDKRDMTRVQTPQNLEQKYDFSEILGLQTAYENQKNEIVQIQNELLNTLNALTINLGDLVETQSNVSLWFYPGSPTAQNEPESNWYDNSTLPNLVTNGDFPGIENGWLYAYGTGAVVNNELEFTITSQASEARIEQIVDTPIVVGHKYYLSAKVKHKQSGIQLRIRIGGSSEYATSVANEYVHVSGVVTAIDTGRFRLYTPSSTATIGDKYYFDDIVAIDLTEEFGAGNEPTKEQMDNPPSKVEHVGDIYYDVSTGNVYMYQSDFTWKQNFDVRLIQAMALTNAQVDTNVDNERKVFFSEPVPSYESGDWWIKEDGELWICQVGRATGIYVEDDFIVSSNFANANATGDGNMLTVISGAVNMIKAANDSFTVLLQNTTTLANSLGETIGTLQSDMLRISADAQSLDVRITSTKNKVDDLELNGVGKVVTVENGFTFDDEGLLLTRNDGTGISTLITNNGLDIISNKDNIELEKIMLEIDSTKINARNMNVEEYFNIGGKTRIQNYENGGGLFII